ncbi:Sodium/calcium exchanger protein-domain-containing protein [Truncatella angustata]|uniref:Sodium/calcium exchanger protein-domain-containing protein n=1 Tax=Truncatella angustata TaxID=152316 RepID=A0A9P8UR55_9PEZI|nr:Sodium/calcium exchanger protein-domain-containing protein [Truncatella angustata]KAH6656686.1 Sodium/calcium exchanger protein-domain-containing protein [Truncatella angustata]
MPRRASSNVNAPHRGEVFSTDDAVDEVEEQATERTQSFSTPRPQSQKDSRPSSTLRRRTAAAAPTLSRVQSSGSVDGEEPGIEDRLQEIDEERNEDAAEEGEGAGGGGEDAPDIDEEEDDDGNVSDAESFTLKDRQQAINETHPFGIRLWKPALYKKDRSVQKTAEGDIHSSPGGHVSNWLLFFNILWTLMFGWWMSFFAAVGAGACFIFAAAPSGREYGRVLWGLSRYLFYPFGKYVGLEHDEAYLDEDQGEGRSISEYEQWQSGDLEYGRLFFGPEEPDQHRSIVGRSRRSIDSDPDETDSLLGRAARHVHLDEQGRRLKRRLFGRGQWNIGRVIFFVFFYGLLTPSLIIVSATCWFLVFWIPMGKVTMLLFDHLRRHPLALSFESDIALARTSDVPHSNSILLCTYRAVGSKYWKYTIDGTNIFLINLMAVVLFVIFDWLVLDGVLHMKNFLTHPGFLFVAGLLSIIPLAYFIGQAVASISAQSSMGLGAAINAFFSTVVEVFLYCVALKDGKGALVEGSIIGSIFAGILLLPGLSMCFGAIKRKTQRFNARSAGVTSTMLLFAVVAAFGPTLFYQIYGTHELNCLSCIDYPDGASRNSERDCRRCYFSQTPNVEDRFYLQAVRPFCYAAAIFLFLSYVTGLWFTLRTHAAVIWNTEIDEKKHEEVQHLARLAEQHQMAADTSGADIRDSHLYKRILGQSLKQVGLGIGGTHHSRQPSARNGAIPTAHMVPPRVGENDANTEEIRSHVHMRGFTEQENNDLIRGVTELAATAAAIAARDARSSTRRISANPSHAGSRPTPLRTSTFPDAEERGEAAHAQGGHDAPNWSRMKSAIILCAATVLYAIVAEILVDTVDVVLQNFAIDEKLLGITLFALVPNTTEFLNAISFAMNGNIALSMEIGSAYALQVCLLQIPALVLFSAFWPPPGGEGIDLNKFTFSLLFPQWDMVMVILCVFLLSYVYGEGKSNYFKGSILIMTYLVVIIGFYFSGVTNDVQMGMNRFDTFNAAEGAWSSYKTIGRSTKGPAF